MKVAPLLLIAALAACKPSSSAKSTEGSAAPAATTSEPAREPAAPREPPPLPPPTVTGSGSADAIARPIQAVGSGLDTDGDGIVSGEERDAARIKRAQQQKQQQDDLRAQHRARRMNGSDE